MTNTLDEGGGYDEEDEEEGGEPDPSRHGRPRSDRSVWVCAGGSRLGAAVRVQVAAAVVDDECLQS
jgi:hypothetical protein